MFTELKYINYRSSNPKGKCGIFKGFFDRKRKILHFCFNFFLFHFINIQLGHHPQRSALGQRSKCTWVFIGASFCVCVASFISWGRAHARPRSTL